MRYLSCWDVTGMTRLKCACMEIQKQNKKQTYFKRVLIYANNVYLTVISQLNSSQSQLDL